MTTQAYKYELGMAGEFLVAGELWRRGIHCNVTYGNAKKVDVVALSDKTQRFVALEIKTTSQKRWIIGSSVPEPSEKLWVFVYLPPDVSNPPEFYVFSSAELHHFLDPQHKKYCATYLAKHGKEFIGPGVENVTYQQARAGHNQWEKLSKQLDKLPES